MTLERNNMSAAAIDQLIAQHVADALAEYEANRNSGNGNGNENGNGSHDLGTENRRTLHTVRECTYKEFLNCQPLNFKGTKGAVRLAHWIVGHDATYGMPWKTLMKMMTKTYCPRSEIKKLETELWNLTVKSIELARSLMDQKVRAYTDRQADNKRMMDNNSRDNNAQQPPYKRQNVARAYSVGPSEKNEYARTLPLYNKWKMDTIVVNARVKESEPWKPSWK
ncbi:hypothetical protein Tco_0150790 [Tanacetum coccineum]